MLFNAVRIAAWQMLALFVAFAALTGNPVAAAGGCLLLVASAVRIDGRWLDQVLKAYLWYRSERAFHHGTPLDAVAAGLTTHAYTDRAGNRIGLAETGREWTAVLRLDRPATGGAGALLDRLAETLSSAEGPEGAPHTAVGGIRLASVQLVRWAVPRPSGPDSAAHRRAWDVHWIAIRFDPAADPRAVAARGGGRKGAMAATAVAALRLAMRLRQAGFTAHPVEEPHLRAELVSSLGEPGKTREAWRWWSVGSLHHATFLAGAPADPAQLLAWTAPAPALSTCTAILLRPKDRGVRRVALTRIAVPGDRKDRAAIKAALHKAAKGLRMKPMNGRQRAGVRSTLPLG